MQLNPAEIVLIKPKSEICPSIQKCVPSAALFSVTDGIISAFMACQTRCKVVSDSPVTLSVWP